MSSLWFPVRVPSELLEALGEHTGVFWSDSLGMEPFICEAIRDYMKPPPAVEPRPRALSEAGYQWKQVFLPDGTRLRAGFGGKSYFAVVEGAEIRYGDRSMSPSGFANLHGSGNRNAWKAVWLRLPGSDEWLLADVCRGARQAAIARLFGAPAADPHQAGAPRQEHRAPPNSDKRPAPRPMGAGGEPSRVARQPSALARPPAARPTTARAPAAAASADDRSAGVKRKTRRARGKRRGKKGIPGKP
ncbi:MAG TPA: hypothetical protein VF616_15030 [Duganella sp.]|uniref:hypothetical protein n=1 Tax=Duganella sp. TaxID=1904440 RepID=UPI002ED68C0C